MVDKAARMEGLKGFDDPYYAQYGIIAGMDEAGRGPLFGPVVAAAVVLPREWAQEDIFDSKKLTEKKRAACAEQIKEHCVCYGIGQASAWEIDEYNILGATRLAMHRAVEALQAPPGCLLVDHIVGYEERMPVISIVRGDQKSFSIACASILAKTERDALMEDFAREYPGYELEKHKGYPTKAHYEAIFARGITNQHRRSFLRNLKNHA